MDDFIFKVPKLPEDSVISKRKGNNFNRQKTDSENWNEPRGNRINSFQASLLDRRNLFGNHSQLQPLREGIQEDLTLPSTSQGRKVLQNRNNEFGAFHSSFGRFGNGGVNEVGFIGKYNVVNATAGDNQRQSVYNSVNLPRMSHSGMGARAFGNGFNFNSLQNSHQSLTLSSSFKNSFQDKSDMYRARNSGFFIDQNRYEGGNNMVEPSHSVGMWKSCFGNQTFPKTFGMTRDAILNESMSTVNSGMNPFNSFTRTRTMAKDSHTFLNASQSIVDNQTIMKSVLQMSLVSIKEQVMNKLENLGHALLRNAPGMESSFVQTSKDIKNILENSILVNPISDATGTMSFVSYSSGAIGQQQSILQNEANRDQSETIKKPSSIFQNLLKRNENPKFELMKSFTVNQKKKTENCKDVSFDESTIMENLNAPRRSDDKKELNLWDWYPVFQKNSLAFVGINEDNAQIETGTVKKRINNRRVLLDDGIFCNLNGNPSTGKNIPAAVSTQIKNGLNLRWKVLATILEKFQGSTKKEKAGMMEEGGSTTTEFETSLNTTVMTRSTTKLLKISNVNNRRVRGKENEKEDLNLVSPKGAKIKCKSTKEADNRAKKRKSDETKNKTESSGKKRACSPVEKHPVKMQKRDSTGNGTVEEPGSECKPTERILCTTKSGRVVRRPKDIWIGGGSNENKKPAKQKEEEEEKEKEEEAEKIDERLTRNEPTKAKQPTKSVRKVKEKTETKQLKSTVNTELEDANKSPVAAKGKGKTTKKVTSKVSTKSNTNNSENPWGNDIDGLDDILVPNISIHHEDIKSDPKKLKLLSMETPPLKIIRSNLTFLKNQTPVQSPDWQISRHTRSAVKKFEKLRAQAFKMKIPKENALKKEKKSKNPVRSNKDVDTVLNWISEREVRSPKKCSNVLHYIMPKRNDLEDEEEESGKELGDEEEM